MALTCNARMVMFGFPDENTTCGIIQQLLLDLSMKTKFMHIFRLLHCPAEQHRYRKSWNGEKRMTCLWCYCRCFQA